MEITLLYSLRVSFSLLQFKSKFYMTHENLREAGQGKNYLQACISQIGPELKMLSKLMGKSSLFILALPGLRPFTVGLRPIPNRNKI